MQRPDKYLPWLLKSFLRSPRTAREVMQEFDCCKPTAYKRLRAVGAVRLREHTREGSRGPKSVLWTLPVP
jgi:hypothetical protein